MLGPHYGFSFSDLHFLTSYFGIILGLKRSEEVQSFHIPLTQSLCIFDILTVVYYLLAKLQTSIQVAFGPQVSPGTSGLRVAQSCLIFDTLIVSRRESWAFESSEPTDKRRRC